jgi:RecG-like helicase
VLEVYSKSESSMSTSHMINVEDPRLTPQLKTIEPRSEQSKPPSAIRKETIEPFTTEGSAKKRLAKITNFPSEFGRFDELYEDCKNGEWKKRIQSIREAADLTLQFPNEFCQYRSSSRFMDLLAQQILEPNIKVSLHATQLAQELMEPLKALFESNLSIITNSIFNNLSSNKQELRDEAEKACNVLFAAVDIGLLLQHLCHGCLYSLPKSKGNLLNKLIRFLEPIYQNRNSLVNKHIIPMLNKLIDENKAEFSPVVLEICRKLISLMGEDFYLSISKPNVVRDLMVG